jgi:hypothetical protein
MVPLIVAYIHSCRVYRRLDMYFILPSTMQERAVLHISGSKFYLETGSVKEVYPVLSL